MRRIVDEDGRRRETVGARGQSEVIGVILLTGVVVLSASAIGLAYVETSTQTDEGPRADVDIAVGTDVITVSHNGGDGLRVADVRMIVAVNGSRVPYAFDDPKASWTGGTTFEPGEEWRNRSRTYHPDATVEVTFIHAPSNTVVSETAQSPKTTTVASSRRVAPSRSATGVSGSGPGTGSTATPTPTPGSTPTSTPTPADTTSPTVTVEQPNGGERLRGGETYEIRWSASDAGTGVETVYLRYETRSDSRMIDAVENTGSYAWTLPDGKTTTGRIRVDAEDGAGNVGTDRSDDQFTVDGTAPSLEGFELTSTGREVTVTLTFDEQVVDLGVPIETSDGTTVETLTAEEFTETRSGLDYRYETTYTVSADGTYRAALATAEDGVGNDGASDQTRTVTTRRIVAYADDDRDRVLDAGETTYTESDLQAFDEAVHLVVREDVSRPKFDVKATTIALQGDMTTSGSNSVKLTATSGAVDTDGGTTIRAPSVSVSGESVAAAGAVDATAGAATVKATKNGGGSVNLSSVSGDSVSVSGTDVRASAAEITARTGSVSVTATESGGGPVDMTGARVEGDGVTLSGIAVEANYSRIDAGTGGTTLKATTSGAGEVAFGGARVTGASVSVAGQSASAAGARVDVDGGVSVDVTKSGGGTADFGAATVSGTSLTVGGTTVDVGGATLATTGGSVSLTADRVIADGGSIDATGGSVSVSDGTIAVPGATVRGDGVTLSGTDVTGVGGGATLDGRDQSVTVTGTNGPVELPGGTVRGSSVAVKGTRVDTTELDVVVADSASIKATTNGGDTLTLVDGDLAAGSVTTEGVDIDAAGVTLDVDGSVSLKATASGGGTVTLVDGDVTAGSVTAEATEVDANRSVTTVTDSLTLKATTSGSGPVTLSDASVTADGTIEVTGASVHAPEAVVDTTGGGQVELTTSSYDGSVRLVDARLDGSVDPIASLSGGGTLYVDAAEFRTDGEPGTLNNEGDVPVDGCPAVGTVDPRDDDECISDAERTQLKDGTGNPQAGSGSGNSGNNGKLSFEVENTGSETVTVTEIEIVSTSADADQVSNGNILTVDGTQVLTDKIPIPSSESMDFIGSGVDLNGGDSATFQFDKFRQTGGGKPNVNMAGERLTVRLHFGDGSSTTFDLDIT
jgi:hypothetical protein